ncbi:MAG: 2-oxoacid:ferredoxin oxidoreductase subunit beta [bacterium]|nr:2-oxoacid:ferredoxin oxidoreductase subunit beta [bacterium]
MNLQEESERAPLTRKDLITDQAVRWCPGCGDYAILAQMQKVMPELGIPRENIVFVSGIGCSSRFPYYMNTYGFHTIHGRAPAVATGLKLARPELSVWVVTGDGDSLSIGGNHLIHTLRRNHDVNVLLFNNKVYGLTKGQFSPTSDAGMKTKSSPNGSVARPFQALSLALGAEATFVARAVDTEANHLQEMIRRMAHHKGTAFLEIYQNCPVFFDGAYQPLKDRQTKADELLVLEQGKPLVYGRDADRVMKLNSRKLNLYPSRLGVKDDGVEVLHDEHNPDPTLATLLSRLGPSEGPTPIGVMRDVDEPTFEEATITQKEALLRDQGPGTLEELLDAGDRWEV